MTEIYLGNIKGPAGDSYILTEEDYQHIAQIVEDNVTGDINSILATLVDVDEEEY